MKLTSIKGIGPQKEKKLNALGIHSVEELIRYFPTRYETIQTLKDIRLAKNGAILLLPVSTIQSPSTWRYGHKSITTLEVENLDIRIQLKWFNSPFASKAIHKQKSLWVMGKIDPNAKSYTMVNPKISVNRPDIRSIMPVYRTTKGISQSDWARFVAESMSHKHLLPSEYLSTHILAKQRLMGREQAYAQVHFPDSMEMLEHAIKRIKYDEWFIFLAAIHLRKKRGRNRGISMSAKDHVDQYISTLPFQLTHSQASVIDDILKDMSSSYQMNRLLQGDVGSGKTVVAFCAAINAYFSNNQVAFMAPTEVLAKQHMEKLGNYFKEKNIKVATLTGSTPAIQREQIYRDLKTAQPMILFGTHALFQDSVEFGNLGLVITDEQHRFGVKQRAEMISKGNHPDVLVMSATPIPRTLSLTFYGDLEISTIKERPKGRTPIQSFAVSERYEERIFQFILQKIQKNEQVYVVCPRIDADEDSELMDVNTIYERLISLPPLKGCVEILHGKRSSEEKQNIMNNFYNKKTQVLIATTVIEVGIDVADATCMVVYNAERFGLSQLHQLRGRVGRGSKPSHFIMICMKNSKRIHQRIKVLVDSDDGFEIAEQDLQLRGAGEILGTMQHGPMSFDMVDLYEDQELLRTAYQDVEEHYLVNPSVSNDSDKRLNEEIDLFIKHKTKIEVLN